jgi:hypothetical protein
MAWGVVVGIGAVVVIAATLAVRSSIPSLVRTVVLVAGAVVVGLGAIGLQDHASTLEWVLTPVVLGALSVLHDRLLFAGDGPGRI